MNHFVLFTLLFTACMVNARSVEEAKELNEFFHSKFQPDYRKIDSTFDDMVDIMNDLWGPYLKSNSMLKKKFTFKDFANGFKIGFDKIVKPILTVLPQIINAASKKNAGTSYRYFSDSQVNDYLEEFLYELNKQFPELVDLMQEHMPETVEIIKIIADQNTMLKKKFTFKDFANGFKIGFDKIVKPILTVLPQIISIAGSKKTALYSGDEMNYIQEFLEQFQMEYPNLIKPIADSWPELLEILDNFIAQYQDDYNPMLKKKFNFKEFAKGFQIGFNAVMKPVLSVLPQIVTIGSMMGKRDLEGQNMEYFLMELMQQLNEEFPYLFQLFQFPQMTQLEIIVDDSDADKDTNLFKNSERKHHKHHGHHGHHGHHKKPHHQTEEKLMLKKLNYDDIPEIIKTKGFWDDLQSGLSDIINPIKESIPQIIDIVNSIKDLNKA